MHTEGYIKLKQFLTEKMRMSHVYQPLMIRTLLEQEGQAESREIAQAFLLEDESQIDYYQQIVKRYPGQVLKKHGIVVRDNNTYALTEGFQALTDDERSELIQLCEDKLFAYVQKRLMSVWEHRFISDGYIPGSLRYDVLRRAKGRCECCGVSSDERAIDIDHIIPKKRGGTDDPSNLQALCYQCNRQKRDRDDTDFSKMKKSYAHREQSCLFCEIKSDRIIQETELAYVVRDAYPVTKLHSLIIPKRHVVDWFDLYSPEHNSILSLLTEQREEITKMDSSVQGFNVGINSGAIAGQTVFHSHIHLIPRRAGDISNPEGGIRSVIPGKGSY